jgi:hypothetical protein
MVQTSSAEFISNSKGVRRLQNVPLFLGTQNPRRVILCVLNMVCPENILNLSLIFQNPSASEKHPENRPLNDFCTHHPTLGILLPHRSESPRPPSGPRLAPLDPVSHLSTTTRTPRVQLPPTRPDGSDSGPTGRATLQVCQVTRHPDLPSQVLYSRPITRPSTPQPRLAHVTDSHPTPTRTRPRTPQPRLAPDQTQADSDLSLSPTRPERILARKARPHSRFAKLPYPTDLITQILPLGHTMSRVVT